MEHIDSVLSSITPLSEDEMGHLSGGFASCKLPGYAHRPIDVKNYFQCACNNYCRWLRLGIAIR